MSNKALKPEDPITVEEALEVAEEAMMLGSIPQPKDPSEYPQAIAVFPGLGEWWRIAHAVDMLCQADSRRTTHLFITGYNCKEETYVQPTLENLDLGFLAKRFTVVVPEAPSEDYTPQQAAWLVRQLVSHGIQHVGLVVSQYHRLRAYQTLLKRCLVARLDIDIVPLAPCVSPLTLIPETKQPMMWRYRPEIERLIRYRRKGDVATHAEFVDAVKQLWLFNHETGLIAEPHLDPWLANPFFEAAGR